MARITVHYVNGETQVFPETSRPGGSYCTTCKTENGWCTIKDAWGKETRIPSGLISKVEIESSDRW